MERLRVNEEGCCGDGEDHGDREDAEQLFPHSMETPRPSHKVARWGLPLVLCGLLASACMCWHPCRQTLNTADADGVIELQEGINLEVKVAEIMKQQQPLPHPPNVVLYISRQQDFARSIADRFAGLFGAAFFAMSTGRDLQIFWPELEEVFSEKRLQWRYDPLSMEIGSLDQASLNVGKFASAGGATFQGLTADVKVLDGNVRGSDDRVSFLWRSQPSAFSNATASKRLVVIGANRGGSIEWYQKLRQSGKLPSNAGYWDLYRGIYNALFSLRGDFAQSPVSMRSFTTGSSQILESMPPLQHYLEVLSNLSTFSLGVHIAASEWVKNSERSGDGSTQMCNDLIPVDQLAQNFWCAEHLASAGRTDTHRVLVLFTDSHCVREHVFEHFWSRGTFSEIWTQEVPAGGEDGFKQTMFDWTLTRHVSMTAVDGSVTGLMASSLVTADARKPIYELSQCRELARDALCQSMFC